MLLPPSVVGAAHNSTDWLGAEMTDKAVGAPGTVKGVAVTGAEATPAPLRFTALTRNAYVVALLRPVTVYDVVVTELDTTVQLIPPSALRSTT